MFVVAESLSNTDGPLHSAQMAPLLPVHRLPLMRSGITHRWPMTSLNCASRCEKWLMWQQKEQEPKQPRRELTLSAESETSGADEIQLRLQEQMRLQEILLQEQRAQLYEQTDQLKSALVQALELQSSL